MISIPNGYTVLAQNSNGFVAVHRLSGKAILGKTATDLFSNAYVCESIQAPMGHLHGAISGTSRNGSTEAWRRLMADLMASLVKSESIRVRDAQRALTAGE